ncbi:MAG: glycosyltransferase [Chitinophagaceae bacterium]|nr:MAG: glycosyltransferase [Chitinophagaceae bacterium]
MKIRKIGIVADGFINWGGGIDLIRFITMALLIDKSYEIVLLIPKKNDTKRWIKNILKKIIKREGVQKLNLHAFDEFKSQVTLRLYKDNLKCLEKVVRKEKIDILIPCIYPIKGLIRFPSVGYLYDFQHKYYPQFFSREEIDYRDKLFGEMVDMNSALIVNSLEVKKDILKFYPKSTCRIFSLPFCPVFIKSNINGNFYSIKQVYGLPDKFFLISNQFWMHKSHITAFEALRLMYNSLNSEEVKIVCTGDFQDYRSNRYFLSLKEKIEFLGLQKHIFFLGYIPKAHQIQILLNSIAVIQPTLFEGGPGGGAVYEAVAYGKSSIVSDIPINLEIESELVTFFKAGDSKDLAIKMQESFINFNIENVSKVDYSYLENISIVRLTRLKAALDKAINYELENWNK